MARALVTGGAGFVGSHLCEALLKRGWEVTCVDNFSTGSRESVAHLGDLEVIEGDVNDAQVWEAVQDRRWDAVFHYAAVVGVRRTEEYPVEVLRDVEGILHVVRLAQEGVFKKVVFASSSEVYGDPEVLPEVEATGQAGWSPYATVKLFGEHALQALWEKHRVPAVSLRFFNVYGPRQRSSDYGFVVAQFVQQVQAGEAPTVYGDGAQTRDFVYIEDNIRAALAALECETAWGEVLNVGTGRETRIVDLAESVIAVGGQRGVLEPVFLPSRAVEIQRRWADTAKMEELLNMRCEVSLEEGLRRLGLGASAPRSVVLPGRKQLDALVPASVSS